MKIAVVGSRNLSVTEMQLKNHLSNATEIVSGGAKGIDACARVYANHNHIKFTEFLPDYSRYGRAAPIVRNKKIVDYADQIIVFWDGSSKGTLSVIRYAEKIQRPCHVILLSFPTNNDPPV